MQFFYPRIQFPFPEQQPAVEESHRTDRLREEAIREQLQVSLALSTQERHFGPGMKTWARMFDDDDELAKFALKVANHAEHEGDREIAKKWRGIYCKMIENKITIIA